ncbi:MAG TPA: hypothetical protein VFX01_08860 [Methylophilaceae bacterium]|nr:hypothetical protein [Methylophilaceae bacterium]
MTSKFIDSNSQSAILYSLSLPLSWIVFDGQDYWIVYGSGSLGWNERRPYKGHTAGLRVAGAYIKLCIRDLPFLPGYGLPEQVAELWENVRRVH